MKVQYFDDTDTLLIELRANDVAETRDLDENTVLGLDATGNLCALTLEHASARTDIHQFTVEGIAYHAALSDTLDEWASREDEEAFCDLDSGDA